MRIVGTCPELPELKYSAFRWELNCSLITPMLGGGCMKSTCDSLAPIRVQSINGQLRHFWREFVCTEPNPIAKRCVEELLWGSTERPGVVQLRLDMGFHEPKWLNPAIVLTRTSGDNPTLRPKLNAALPAYAAFGLESLLTHKTILDATRVTQRSYGLDVREANNSAKWQEPVHQVLRILAPGNSFRLTVRLGVVEDKYIEAVDSTLRAWTTLGGVGARTRRGFGAIRCAHYAFSDERELGAYLRTLPHRRIALHRMNHGEAVEQLKAIRQAAGPAPAARRAGYGRDIHETRWPEPWIIRTLVNQQRQDPVWELEKDFSGTEELAGETPGCLQYEVATLRAFPRAAFGMPITFEMPKDVLSNEELRIPQPVHRRERNVRPTLVPKGQQRMSSPLLIRPVQLKGDNMVSVFFQLKRNLPHELTLLPGKTRIRDGHTVNADLIAAVDVEMNNPRCAIYAGSPMVHSHDAIEAFFSFLARKRLK